MQNNLNLNHANWNITMIIDCVMRSGVEIDQRDAESLPPVSLTMLSSFVQIVKQTLIHFIADLAQMLVHFYSLVLAILTRTTIT